MSETFELGPYTVRLGLRADNPAFPVHIIMRGEKLIGKQFSRPCLDDCRALEREHSEAQKAERIAAAAEQPAFQTGEGFHNGRLKQHRRPGPGRPRKLSPQPA